MRHSKKGEADMAFELPDLPYDYEALAPYMSAKTLHLHHDKHHQAYVTNLNNLIEGTEFAGKSLEEIVTGSYGDAAKQGIFNNAGQHWNHNLFWRIMKKGGGGNPGGELAKRIDDAFGSFEAFKEQFKTAGVTQFGSGWAWLAVRATSSRWSRRPTARTRWSTACGRSWASTSGSMPTTSTTRIAGPSTWRRSSTSWSTGSEVEAELHKALA